VGGWLKAPAPSGFQAPAPHPIHTRSAAAEAFEMVEGAAGSASSRGGGGGPIDYASGDHYQVLGLRRDADDGEIARAYKVFALRHHPDKNLGNAQAEVAFKRIAEAYAVLKDPAKRREYESIGGTRSYVSYEEAERMWQQQSSAAASGVRVGGMQNMDAGARRKAIGIVLMSAVFLWNPGFLISLAPGILAACAAFFLLSKRSGRTSAGSKLALCALAFVLSFYLVPWAVRAVFGTPLAAERLDGGHLLPKQGPWVGQLGDVADGVHSGEEVLLGDGTFVRIADPKVQPGSPTLRGWQQRLWGAAKMAAEGGEHQVVMVFSRQGCPWCDRQVPVIRRAILRRMALHNGGTDAEQEEPQEAAEDGEVAEKGGLAPPETAGPAADDRAPPEPSAAMAAPKTPRGARKARCHKSAPAAAFLFAGTASIGATGGGGSKAEAQVAALLRAPLRVFVLDEGELPELADLYQIQAFPTIVAWGLPGAQPLMAQGYLDDSAFEKLLHEAARGGDEELAASEAQATR